MLKEMFKGKRVIVTGNTGFKGSWLTVWLLKLGANVYGISKDVPTEPSMFDKLGLKDKISHIECDISNKEVIEIIGEVKPDYLFHLAAQAIVSLSYKDPIGTITSNVLGTANILEGLRLSNHECSAVIITSDKCYDNVEWVWGYRETDRLGGKDIYSGSKGAAELLIKSYYHSFLKDSNVKLASARAGNVIGGGDWAVDRIVPDCMRAWSNKKAVEIRNPNATRPWQHVLEPLSGYMALALKLSADDIINGESFNFGPRAECHFTVRQLIEEMSKYWGFEDKRLSYKTVDGPNFHEAGLLKLNCDKALYYLEWLPTLEYEKMIEFVSLWYYRYYNGEGNMHEFTLGQIEEYEHIARGKELKWAQ